MTADAKHLEALAESYFLILNLTARISITRSRRGPPCMTPCACGRRLSEPIRKWPMGAKAYKRLRLKRRTVSWAVGRDMKPKGQELSCEVACAQSLQYCLRVWHRSMMSCVVAFARASGISADRGWARTCGAGTPSPAAGLRAMRGLTFAATFAIHKLAHDRRCQTLGGFG